MSPIAVGTIIAKNYLAHARVLADSLRQHHPELALHVALIDEPDGYFDLARERFVGVPLHDLPIPLRELRKRSGVKELAAAVKPFLLQHLFDLGHRTALFLDPDTLVLDDLSSLFAAVAAHDVVLTPHLTAALSGEGRIDRELNIILSGVFNGGVVGASATDEGRRFVSWWSTRVLQACRDDVYRGLYYDQRWLDLAPVFFEDVHVFRDPSYNVAHWNLPERGLTVRGEGVWIDDRPCRLFHFSGFDPRRPSRITGYSKRLGMAEIGGTEELFRRYAGRLRAAGFDRIRRWPYRRGH